METKAILVSSPSFVSDSSQFTSSLVSAMEELGINNFGHCHNEAKAQVLWGPRQEGLSVTLVYKRAATTSGSQQWRDNRLDCDIACFVGLVAVPGKDA
ncbi:unnamed protein product [Lupinus luteus]|uniref:Uncharacterized protein n=1 Tax=Lupinus luteus TaxID=3873 RepID=A0AAV1W452_LUPLU